MYFYSHQASLKIRTVRFPINMNFIFVELVKKMRHIDRYRCLTWSQLSFFFIFFGFISQPHRFQS